MSSPLSILHTPARRQGQVLKKRPFCDNILVENQRFIYNPDRSEGRRFHDEQQVCLPLQNGILQSGFCSCPSQRLQRSSCSAHCARRARLPIPSIAPWRIPSRCSPTGVRNRGICRAKRSPTGVPGMRTFGCTNAPRILCSPRKRAAISTVRSIPLSRVSAQRRLRSKFGRRTPMRFCPLRSLCFPHTRHGWQSTRTKASPAALLIARFLPPSAMFSPKRTATIPSFSSTTPPQQEGRSAPRTGFPSEPAEKTETVISLSAGTGRGPDAPPKCLLNAKNAPQCTSHSGTLRSAPNVRLPFSVPYPIRTFSTSSSRMVLSLKR